MHDLCIKSGGEAATPVSLERPFSGFYKRIYGRKKWGGYIKSTNKCKVKACPLAHPTRRVLTYITRVNFDKCFGGSQIFPRYYKTFR